MQPQTFPVQSTRQTPPNGSVLRIETGISPPEDWDEYVSAHPSATAYHLAAAVSIGTKTFGLRTSFLSARDAAGRCCGVLPLVEQSSVLFGRFLVSVPFFTYGGMLADTNSIAIALAEHAVEVARSRKADHLELRHSAPITGLQFPERLDKVSMVLSLPGSEAALSKQLGSKLRSQIRRAEREDLQILWGREELVRDFYRVFGAGMHELGTPVYPRRFFDYACAAFGPLCDVLVLRLNGEPQAAAIVVRHGRRIEVPWAAATPAAKKVSGNMRMYWEMLRHSIEVGAESFDFGRSSLDSGTYRFKAQWGAEPMQLHWHYWLRKAGSLPALNHSNPRYAAAGALWRRMPLWFANRLGPFIARNLP